MGRERRGRRTRNSRLAWEGLRIEQPVEQALAMFCVLCVFIFFRTAEHNITSECGTVYTLTLCTDTSTTIVCLFFPSGFLTTRQQTSFMPAKQSLRL